MKTTTKRLVLAACVLCAGGAAMAGNPKTSIDTDAKNSKVVNVVATSDKGDTANYHCHYAWEVTQTLGGTSNDACEADVPAGSNKVAVCSKTYAKKVNDVRMLDAACKAI